MGKIAIIGAGLSGLMCAINMARRNYEVHVFEKRTNQDILQPRYNLNGKIGRSMSMDLSERGLHALKKVGLLEKVSKHAVPMMKKIFHMENGMLVSIPYGRKAEEHILTISRTHLYQLLLAECSRYAGIKIHFAHELIDIDITSKKLHFTTCDNKEHYFFADIVIGSDGTNSKVREYIELINSKKFYKSLFSHSYKELSLPAGTPFEIEAMHIWPREEFMLVAQPNFDNSFTAALILKNDNSLHSFNSLKHHKTVKEFFARYFADALKYMPNLNDEFKKNPVGTLTVITGATWTAADFMLVIGDAAHSMVPFFGQGVNCCFEDCTVLDEILTAQSDNWSQTLKIFNDMRVADANAISAMSSTNYPELLEKPDIDMIMREKEIELFLCKNFAEIYRSYHNLVCFDRMPYTKIAKVRSLQKKLLAHLSHRHESSKELNARELIDALHHYEREIKNP